VSTPQENRLTAGPDALLVEYQKAQDSAEHHDGRIANVTSLWVGTAVLMGFVLSALTKKGRHMTTGGYWCCSPPSGSS
jgi:hypothetical protein